MSKKKFIPCKELHVGDFCILDDGSSLLLKIDVCPDRHEWYRTKWLVSSSETKMNSRLVEITSVNFQDIEEIIRSKTPETN